ncbi:MAG: hypothetical protein J6C55_02400 [Oscillospiraceae bacterium]|nr:hypothetical protein [Oscillospiraceae bacterium]
MARAILIMFLSSLTIIGFYDIFKSIKSIIFRPQNSNFSIVLPIKENDENIEYQIRCLSNLIETKNYNSNLIIADMGMDFETLQICHSVAEQDNKIIICGPQEVKYFACDAL